MDEGKKAFNFTDFESNPIVPSDSCKIYPKDYKIDIDFAKNNSKSSIITYEEFSKINYDIGKKIKNNQGLSEELVKKYYQSLDEAVKLGICDMSYKEKKYENWAPGWPPAWPKSYPVKKPYKSSSATDYSDEYDIEFGAEIGEVTNPANLNLMNESFESASKINTAINYTVGVHTHKNNKDILDETGSVTIRFMIKSVTVTNRVSFGNHACLIDDEDGDWFVIKILFNSQSLANNSCERIVYNFKKNRYFVLSQTANKWKDINGEKDLGYEILPYSLGNVSKMDLLEWLMIRKAIYLERFDLKTNIKDVYDPVVLNLSSFIMETATLQDIENSISEDSEYDLLDLED